MFSGNGLLNNDARSGTGNYAHANSAAPTSTKFTLQTSNQTSDTIALAANAFLNIGGFSTTAVGPVSIAGSATKSNAGQKVLTLVNTTGLAVGMAVTGTNIATGTKIDSIAGDGLSVTLSANIETGDSAAGATIKFGETTINGTAVMALASGSNPPQTLVGTNVYKVIAATYTSIGTVTAVSGNNVTISASSAVTWAANNVIAFSGQLTQVHSAKTDDLSLSQSVASTTNDTADFQMVQRAAEGYVKALSTQRSLLGAYQNQIEYTVSNVTELSANLEAARSNVQDTDYASETATLTKGQILQQAATAMLAQANQMPNVILSLLK
jgi:flagellin